jgi:hypothetical protein
LSPDQRRPLHKRSVQHRDFFCTGYKFAADLRVGEVRQNQSRFVSPDSMLARAMPEVTIHACTIAGPQTKQKPAAALPSTCMPHTERASSPPIIALAALHFAVRGVHIPTAAYVLGHVCRDCYGYLATAWASAMRGTMPPRLSTNASSTLCCITSSYSLPRNARSRSLVMMHCPVM